MLDISSKQLFVFDLDGTLAKSKTPMDAEMDALLSQLLERRRVAVIGGGWLPQFEKQLLEPLTCSNDVLKNLFLFPTSGSCFLRYGDGGWEEVYRHEIHADDRRRIFDVFERAFQEVGYEHPSETYGELIQDRGTQVTFSALGQQAPVEKKMAWRGSAADRRREIVAAMAPHLSDFEIKIPGTTSIDVTMKGIDKGYGIEQMRDRLGVAVHEMIFTGDALYEGGNDEPVKRTGIDTVAINNPEETKKHLRAWLSTCG
ncbi:hypothetical protein A3I45_04690 [Candidatus Uhrbacteria bacterium RIFCSPLOWO2_02_FULL_53_10]|uniref:phosphomannomutase n=1 Tax=Candidatus Uhrbacteria bacterium RIFCSPLOWO2_02_FULL_53_10 TaxID=1802411 RepID=A0A1F7VGA2_9BACT|nr:MAG: hypothetical protein A3I45_04690 [Candidatus Uhrbacteria bacterium RIFCSPLOWO2_02_FULL_53_10]